MNSKDSPVLVRLRKSGETEIDLAKLGGEEFLLRWMNYHLKRSGSNRVAKNFSEDVKDGHVYTHVLHSLNKEKCALYDEKMAPKQKADHAVENAKSIGVPVSISSDDIVSGSSKLNLLFCA